MIEPLGKYYLYRHIRLDKDEVFYIGIGTKINRGKKNNYQRAYTKSKRNSIWKRIVKKSDYEVEILFESNDYDFLKQKEIEFIKLYGRMDLNTGTLANLTDGGEGICGYKPTKEAIEKRKQTMGKWNHTEEDKLKMSLISYRAKKVYQYDLDGNFIKEWKSATEASIFYFGKKSSNFATAAQSKRGTYKCNNSFWCYEKLDYFKPETKLRKVSSIGEYNRMKKWKEKSPKLEVFYMETGNVEMWDSTIDFTEHNPTFSGKCISACCLGYKKSYKKCKFKRILKDDIKSNETDN